MGIKYQYDSLDHLSFNNDSCQQITRCTQTSIFLHTNQFPKVRSAGRRIVTTTVTRQSRYLPAMPGAVSQRPRWFPNTYSN
jgi:hypothetical protein